MTPIDERDLKKKTHTHKTNNKRGKNHENKKCIKMNDIVLCSMWAYVNQFIRKNEWSFGVCVNRYRTWNCARIFHQEYFNEKYHLESYQICAISDCIAHTLNCSRYVFLSLLCVFFLFRTFSFSEWHNVTKMWAHLRSDDVAVILKMVIILKRLI